MSAVGEVEGGGGWDGGRLEGVEGADGAVAGGGAEEWFGKDGGVGGYADDGGGVGVAVGCEGRGVGGLGTDMRNGDEEGNEGREVGEMHCVVVKKTCRGVERGRYRPASLKVHSRPPRMQVDVGGACSCSDVL